MEHSKKDCCISGVGCCVANCVHHTEGDHCGASHIDVQNKTACNKSETFCSTFAPKAGC